jgi:MFS family permease
MSDATIGVIETKIPSRLDRLPWSRFHWRVVIGLGTAWVLDGLEVTIVGSVASRLTSHGSGIVISSAGIGLAAALYVTGACLGALVFGHLTDRLGRKKLFLITLALYIAATAVTAVSFSAWFFFIFRFLTGAGIGGEYAAINSAIDELIPARARGRVDLVINGSYWMGSIFGSALAILFLDTAIFPKDIGWRLTFALGVLLASGVMLVRRHVPESPRWLFIHGKEDEAEAIVDRIEADVSERTAEALEPVDRTLVVHQRRTIGFRSIVHTAVRDYPRRSILCIALFVGQAFIYNGITFNLGTLMTKFFHVATGIVPIFLIMYAAANFLGPLLLGRLFDTVGRIPMIAGTYLGSAVLGVLLAGLFAESGVFNRWTFIAVVMATFFLASAGASAAYLTSSEIFPMETRALSIAFFYAIGTAVGGIAGPLLFGPLITTGNVRLVALAFLIGSVLMGSGAAAEILFGVKAERQQLEDIAQPLTVQAATQAGSPTAPASGEGAAATGTAHEVAAIEHRARAAEHRASAAEHRARFHELIAERAPAGEGAEVEETLAQVEEARALADEELALAADARIGTGAEHEAREALHRARAAELRARGHQEEVEAALASDDREAESHRQLAAAAVERARAAEQLALAAAAEGRGRGVATTEQGGRHTESASHEDGERPASTTANASAMHRAWAEMHEQRALALELRAVGHDDEAEARERRADVCAERARAFSFRVEAAEHRARAGEERGQLAVPAGAEVSTTRTAPRAADDVDAERARIRERMRQRREREASGLRRYRPGPGRLGRAPGFASQPPLVEEALDREVLSIERALRDHGPTERDELARMVGAQYWGPGVFAEALRQAVADGGVRRLSRRLYGPKETAGDAERADERASG